MIQTDLDNKSPRTPLFIQSVTVKTNIPTKNQHFENIPTDSSLPGP
jgi:hypothetical protein